VIFSLNFPHATTLPVNVTPPIKIERTIVTSVKVVLATGSGGRFVTVFELSGGLRKMAAKPTKSEARPPKPLKSATISGIAVIATMRAAIAPTTEPITTPSRIHL
jgi:hypothetical protein